MKMIKKPFLYRVKAWNGHGPLPSRLAIGHSKDEVKRVLQENESEHVHFEVKTIGRFPVQPVPDDERGGIAFLLEHDGQEKTFRDSSLCAPYLKKFFAKEIAHLEETEREFRKQHGLDDD